MAEYEEVNYDAGFKHMQQVTQLNPFLQVILGGEDYSIGAGTIKSHFTPLQMVRYKINEELEKIDDPNLKESDRLNLLISVASLNRLERFNPKIMALALYYRLLYRGKSKLSSVMENQRTDPDEFSDVDVVRYIRHLDINKVK